MDATPPKPAAGHSGLLLRHAGYGRGKLVSMRLASCRKRVTTVCVGGRSSDPSVSPAMNGCARIAV